MKIAKKIYSWILISAILQVAILLFVDKVYLAQRLSGQDLSDSIKIDIVEFKPQSTEIDKSIDVKVPIGISDTKVSYDGIYVSYIQSGKIEIIDIKNQTNKVIVENKINETLQGQLIGYKWMADRNIIIYCVKTTLANGNIRMWILTYSIDSGDYDGYFEAPMDNLPKDSSLSSFEFSSKTKVLYAKVNISSTKARIYRYNIMENLTLVGEFNSSILFDMTRLDDYLLIKENDIIQIVNGITPWKKQQMNLSGKIKLLKVDTNDKAYIGKLNTEGKIEKILYGKYNEDSSIWQTIVLKSTAEENEIIIKEDGLVFQNVKAQSLFYRLDTNKSTSYKGNLIDILQNCYIIQSEGNIKIIPIKK